ncbi:MAG: drug/metabolite transporter (DMT)-like permease [Roseivirga sp.]
MFYKKPLGSSQALIIAFTFAKIFTLEKNKQLLAHGALLAVAIIYGLNYSIAKDVMPNYILPRGFILVRVAGAVILFNLLSLFFPREKVAKEDYLRIALAGFFGVAANQLLFFEGLNITTPISAAVIMTTNPIMVLSLSAIILKVPLSPAKIIGIVLGITGALSIIYQGSNGNLFNGGESLGNTLVMLNAFSFASYLIVVKPLMAKYKALTVVRLIFMAGLVMVIPFGASQFTEITWSEMPSLIYWEVGFVVIGTTFMAYLLNVYALKTVSSTTVSFYIYLQPLIAAIAATILGTDQLSMGMISSAILIFSGVYLVSFYQRRN